MQDSYRCSTCGSSVTPSEVIRRKTMADLDPKKWQTFCCPDCGDRIKTVFVGLEGTEHEDLV